MVYVHPIPIDWVIGVVESTSDRRLVELEVNYQVVRTREVGWAYFISGTFGIVLAAGRQYMHRFRLVFTTFGKFARKKTGLPFAFTKAIDMVEADARLPKEQRADQAPNGDMS